MQKMSFKVKLELEKGNKCIFQRIRMVRMITKVVDRRDLVATKRTEMLKVEAEANPETMRVAAV